MLVKAAKIVSVEDDAVSFDLGDGDDGEWLHEAVNKAVGDEGAVWVLNEGVRVGTLEGTMRGAEGDWLVCGTEGELYTVKGSIFPTIYEEARDGQRDDRSG